MARFDSDRFDDDDDIPSARAGKRGFPGWAIVLLCTLPVLAVIVIGGAMSMFMAREAQVPRAELGAPRLAVRTPSVGAAGPDGAIMTPVGKDAGTIRVYTRDEFKQLVMGKTLEQLIAAIGQPDATVNSDFGLTHRYSNRTKSPETGQLDPAVELGMKNGRVFEVTY